MVARWGGEVVWKRCGRGVEAVRRLGGGEVGKLRGCDTKKIVPGGDVVRVSGVTKARAGLQSGLDLRESKVVQRGTANVDIKRSW